jgi:hypothetical protein
MCLTSAEEIELHILFLFLFHNGLESMTGFFATDMMPNSQNHKGWFPSMGVPLNHPV